MADDVSLRDYFERVLLEQQRALELQHTETERRLDVLNHAHETAVEVQHTYVTQDKYDDFVRTNEAARDVAFTRADDRITAVQLAAGKDASDLAKRVSELEVWKSKAVGVMALAAPLLLLVGGVVAKAVG